VVTTPTCNLITIDGDNKTVRVTNVDYAAGSAKINKLNLDFGDGAKDYINLNQLPVSHTYSADGTYLVRATLDTSVGNITSDKCTSSITFKGNTKPPVTPPVTPPTTLVNTGPGDVIGIFALVTLVGAVAHRVYTKVLARK
jgi:PKD repeat protein